MADSKRSTPTNADPRPDFSDVRSGSSSTAPSVPGRDTTYVVRKGDTLSEIAEKHYGHASEWRKIFEANRDQIEDPDLIHPGQTLRLP